MPQSNVKKSVVEVLADKLAVLLTSTFGLDGSSLKETQPTVEVTKAEDVEQRRAMFVVLAPNEIDEHGDTNTEECVEKACISFNTLCNKANLFHRINTEKAKIEQSFITPAGFTTDTGIEVKKGSWLQYWHLATTTQLRFLVIWRPPSCLASPPFPSLQPCWNEAKFF